MKRYLIEHGVGGVSSKQPSEAVVCARAKLGGFSASRSTEVRAVIDSMTAMS